MDPRLTTLLARLAETEIGATFNPYRDEDAIAAGDREGAAAVRRRNLAHYLEARQQADVVCVGEATGYQGMRWSGVAFTSERNLLAWGAPFELTSARPEGWAEPSGTILHRVLGELAAEQRVILWNAVPCHPHRPGEPLSNRRPSTAEIELGAPFCHELVEILQPRLLVAIGRVSQSILGEDVPCVRHPANGGANLFAQGMRELLER